MKHFGRSVLLLLMSSAAARTIRRTTEDEKSVKPVVDVDTSGFEAPDDGAGEVYNGVAAAKGEFPAFAKLVYSTSIVCGGVLITTRHVLTAAHCFVRSDLTEFDLIGVRIGATTSTTDGTYYAISKRVYHPGYVLSPDGASRFQLSNDVAVLTLSSAVTGVTPLSFNRNSAYTTTAGTTVTAIGFGRFGSTTSTSSVLRKTTVFTQTDAACAGATSAFYDNTQHMCTYSTNTGTCQGDSGGPVLDSNKLVLGVLSFGLTDCTADSADYYTDLWNYASWIDQQTGAAPTPTPSPTTAPGSCVFWAEAQKIWDGAAGFLSQATRFGSV